MRTRFPWGPLLGLVVAAGCGRAASTPATETRAAAQSTAAASALYEVFVRDFSPSGDFAGVRAGLDGIAGAGVDVIWLMPIQPIGELNRKGTLGSPYSIRDYRALNPDFGTAADFRALVAAVHERGMRIIIDWVPNHTAWDHVWVGAHPEFYTRDGAGRMRVPRGNDGSETDWTDVAELDYDHAGLRSAMIADMLYWLEEFGIDGFRVDVAGMVPDAFWREAIPRLRAAKPDILLLAEWGELHMHEIGFDLTYAWGSYHRLKDVWRGGPAHAFVAAEIAELAGMPEGGLRLRFTTNHDETAWDAPPVELFGGSAGARAAFAAMALLPGPPLLYNGQEVESPQRLPLFERETVQWDRPGADEARAFYRRVIDLSRRHASFLSDALSPITTDAPDDVISYARGDAVVLVNTRPRAITVTVRDIALGALHDLLGGGVLQGATVALPPYGVRVLAPGR